MKRLSVLLILVACAFAQKPDKPLKNGLYAIFNTELGKFTAQLYEKDTPNSVVTFVQLAQGTLASRDPKTNAMVKRPLYDNTTVSGILPGQAIQGAHNREAKLLKKPFGIDAGEIVPRMLLRPQHELQHES